MQSQHQGLAINGCPQSHPEGSGFGIEIEGSTFLTINI